jgi:hypothetical protein
VRAIQDIGIDVDPVALRSIELSHGGAGVRLDRPAVAQIVRRVWKLLKALVWTII